ncbi:MAG: heme ABC transporter ATP-binding protein [Ketobacter sp.]|nr:MAG: heme ABC transporter ATP-binding protein [Ketobacter sp.]
MGSEPVLQMTGLSFRAAGRTLLQPTDLHVLEGECMAVVGPNGAGKSTLFRLLSGEWAPSAGQVMFDGTPLAKWSLAQLAQVRAVMPQSSSLSFPFAARDVILMGRMPHATGREVDAAIVEEVMTVCDVQHLAQRHYTALSGGERQRVQLARVLTQIWQPVALGRRLLLLDEPTSALDLAHQLDLMRLIRDVCGKAVTVLVIVHDLNLAARFADRIMMLHNGQPVAVGSPDEVMRPDLIECVFNVKAQVIEHPLYGCPLVVS